MTQALGNITSANAVLVLGVEELYPVGVQLTNFATDQMLSSDDMEIAQARMGQPATAEGFVEKLKAGYPESQWTLLLTDPFFTQNAREGVHLEDSLYAATYEAFKADRYAEVDANTHLSESRFPLGANRDKFIFIDGLGKLNNGDGTGCLNAMRPR